LEKTRDALVVLDSTVAKAYAEAITWVLEEKEKQGAYTGPRIARIAFKG
jgi:hypothetical protein